MQNRHHSSIIDQVAISFSSNSSESSNNFSAKPKDNSVKLVKFPLELEETLLSPQSYHFSTGNTNTQSHFSANRIQNLFSSPKTHAVKRKTASKCINTGQKSSKLALSSSKNSTSSDDYSTLQSVRAKRFQSTHVFHTEDAALLINSQSSKNKDEKNKNTDITPQLINVNDDNDDDLFSPPRTIHPLQPTLSHNLPHSKHSQVILISSSKSNTVSSPQPQPTKTMHHRSAPVLLSTLGIGTISYSTHPIEPTDVPQKDEQLYSAALLLHESGQTCSFPNQHDAIFGYNYAYNVLESLPHYETFTKATQHEKNDQLSPTITNHLSNDPHNQFSSVKSTINHEKDDFIPISDRTDDLIPIFYSQHLRNHRSPDLHQPLLPILPSLKNFTDLDTSNIINVPRRLSECMINTAATKSDPIALNEKFIKNETGRYIYGVANSPNSKMNHNNSLCAAASYVSSHNDFVSPIQSFIPTHHGLNMVNMSTNHKKVETRDKANDISSRTTKQRILTNFSSAEESSNAVHSSQESHSSTIYSRFSGLFLIRLQQKLGRIIGLYNLHLIRAQLGKICEKNLSNTFRSIQKGDPRHIKMLKPVRFRHLLNSSGQSTAKFVRNHVYSKKSIQGQGNQPKSSTSITKLHSIDINSPNHNRFIGQGPVAKPQKVSNQLAKLASHNLHPNSRPMTNSTSTHLKSTSLHQSVSTLNNTSNTGLHTPLVTRNDQINNNNHSNNGNSGKIAISTNSQPHLLDGSQWYSPTMIPNNYTPTSTLSTDIQTQNQTQTQVRSLKQARNLRPYSIYNHKKGTRDIHVTATGVMEEKFSSPNSHKKKHKTSSKSEIVLKNRHGRNFARSTPKHKPVFRGSRARGKNKEQSADSSPPPILLNNSDAYHFKSLMDLLKKPHYCDMKAENVHLIRGDDESYDDYFNTTVLFPQALCSSVVTSSGDFVGSNQFDSFSVSHNEDQQISIDVTDKSRSSNIKTSTNIATISTIKNTSNYVEDDNFFEGTNFRSNSNCLTPLQPKIQMDLIASNNNSIFSSSSHCLNINIASTMIDEQKDTQNENIATVPSELTASSITTSSSTSALNYKTFLLPKHLSQPLESPALPPLPKATVISSSAMSTAIANETRLNMHKNTINRIQGKKSKYNFITNHKASNGSYLTQNHQISSNNLCSSLTKSLFQKEDSFTVMLDCIGSNANFNTNSNNNIQDIFQNDSTFLEKAENAMFSPRPRHVYQSSIHNPNHLPNNVCSIDNTNNHSLSKVPNSFEQRSPKHAMFFGTQNNVETTKLSSFQHQIQSRPLFYGQSGLDDTCEDDELETTDQLQSNINTIISSPTISYVCDQKTSVGQAQQAQQTQPIKEILNHSTPTFSRTGKSAFPGSKTFQSTLFHKRPLKHTSSTLLGSKFSDHKLLQDKATLGLSVISPLLSAHSSQKRPSSKLQSLNPQRQSHSYQQQHVQLEQPYQHGLLTSEHVPNRFLTSHHIVSANLTPISAHQTASPTEQFTGTPSASILTFQSNSFVNETQNSTIHDIEIENINFGQTPQHIPFLSPSSFRKPIDLPTLDPLRMVKPSQLAFNTNNNQNDDQPLQQRLCQNDFFHPFLNPQLDGHK